MGQGYSSRGFGGFAVWIAVIAAGVVAGVAAGAALAVSSPPGEALPPRPEALPLQLGADAPLVGSQRCRLCHQDISIRFQTENPHNDAVMDVGGTSVTGCETCHGGGGLHASSMDPSQIGRFGLGDALGETAVCLGCHAQEPPHADRFLDPHQENGASCTSCHTVHSSEPATPLLRASPNSLCAGCHETEAARFRQPFAHAVDTNQSLSAIECVDCHSPHGSETGNALLVDHANQAACLDCHSDKRGPFAFEHLPMVTGEGCTSCHEPHGSPNPRMLTRSSVAQLCLECHTNSTTAFGQTPPAFHDLRTMRFQNCTVCHTRIHGSHANASFLR